MANELIAEGEVYATLAGMVNEYMVQKVFQGFTTAMSNHVQKIHLLIQSMGGNVGDGIAIYNFLTHLPIEVIAYNGGSVQSIAVLAFLGAKKRKVSKTATFMLHRSHFSGGVPATSHELKAIAESLALDDARTQIILRAHIRMPEDQWIVHENASLFLSADKSIEYGIADEIADFAPPPGATIFNVVN